MLVPGIDAHNRTVVVVDEVGRKLGEQTTTATTTADHLELVRFADQWGDPSARQRGSGHSDDGSVAKKWTMGGRILDDRLGAQYRGVICQFKEMSYFVGIDGVARGDRILRPHRRGRLTRARADGVVLRTDVRCARDDPANHRSTHKAPTHAPPLSDGRRVGERRTAAFADELQ